MLDTDDWTVRKSIEYIFRVVFVVLVGVTLSTGFAEAQQHEVAIGFTVIDAPASGYEFPFYRGGFSGQVHLFGFDLGSSYAQGNFPKRGTPGGHSAAKSVFVNRWIGDSFYAGANVSRIFGNATSWTKEVEFVGVSGGYRRISGNGHEDHLSVSFAHEYKTDAIQPNRSNQVAVRWLHDFPIKKWLAVRSSFSFALGRFDQFVHYTDADDDGLRWGLPTGEIQRLSSNSITFGMSLILKSR